MNSGFKTELIHLVPILASLLFGLLCAFLILISPIVMYQIAPFPEGVGSFGNALYFVILVGAGATMLYVLLKWKSRRIISLITGFALTTAVFMLSVVYLWAVFSWFNVPFSEALILLLSVGITVLADVAVFRFGGVVCSLAVLGLGGALGAFLGFSIPTLSTVLILVFLAVYDAFAVYHGPVGKIARSGLEQFRGLTFSFKDIQMGLGDLTFYSMLSGHLLLNLGVASAVTSVAGILVGCILSFKMLEKKGMFPGLPFPIALGIATGFAAAFIRV